MRSPDSSFTRAITHQVEHLSRHDEVGQADHNLLHRSVEVPLCQHRSVYDFNFESAPGIGRCCNGNAYPVDVEDIDVARAELLERGLDGEVHGLDDVARVVHFLLNVFCCPCEVRRVLCRPPATPPSAVRP